MKSFGCLLLLSLAAAQKYGVGFGKTTFSTSSGVAVYDWMKAYLPVVMDHPNGPRPCGDVGRARIATSSYPTPFSQGFGLHAVHVNNTSSRIHPECISASEVEKALDAKLSRAAGPAYDAFMDFNSGHWVSSLNPYMAKFQENKVPHTTLSWRDAINSKEYFSVIVRVQPSMMFIELMSKECTACSGATPAPTARYFFGKNESPEDLFGALDDKTAAQPLMHPAKISWPSSNVSRERRYLAEGLGAFVASNQDAAGAVQTDVYDFTPLMAKTAPMQFHVVERAANASSGPLTWGNFEEALMRCHAVSIKDDLCGENAWMDHHMGLAIHGQNQVQTDAEKLKKMAASLGLPFHVTPSNGGGVAVYVIAKNGLSITFQVPQGSYVPPRNMGSGMLDLCGDGTCAAAQELLVAPL